VHLRASDFFLRPRSKFRRKFESMRKLNITVGRCLAVLLWLLVLAASEPSRISLFPLLAPVESSAAASDDSQSVAVRDFEHSLTRVQPLLERYGYGAAFAAVMAEGMGIPTPGQTLLMASALEAAEGRMNITLVLFLVTVAAALGNGVGYAIGRWGGRAALDKLKVNPQRQQHLDDLFKRRGGVVILLARFLDGLRQLNGIVAGVLQMPWWTFTAYNVAGAVLWTCAWGLGTYYLGRDIHFIAAFFHRHRPLLLVLAAVACMALLVYLLRSKRVSSVE
jgi:membrane protein DedA with SNARE-associated domain